MISTSNSSGYDAARVYTGGAAAEANALKSRILSSSNTEEIYDIKGKKHYISKDMKLSNIPAGLSAGDAVLFERGGVWRAGPEAGLSIPNGVIFGAYGEGEKPRIYGSSQNYANNALWKHNGNFWEILLTGGNAGIIVFDEKYALGVKKWTLEEVTADYDFYHDMESGVLTLYYSGDLNKDFYDIEIGQRGDILNLNSNSVLDNICFKYTGSHAVVISSGRENFTVTNCEIGLIGGSHQFGTTRFGNGIEMQLGVKRATVKNNYVYECYDAGITFQSWASAKKDTYYHDITIEDNLIENCYYGFEFFTTSQDEDGVYSEFKNISFSRNIVRFSAYCWSYEQRPDHWMGSHIRCGQRRYQPNCENYRICDNIFDCSRANIVFWWWHDVERGYIHPVPQAGLTVKNNSYFQAPMPDKRCMTFFDVDPVEAEDLEGLKKAAFKFDSAPAQIVWLDTM